MTKAVGLLTIVIAAILVVMGALAVWAGIAAAFPTTEDAFLKIGSLEISGLFLVILGAAFIAGAYFLVRFAASRE